MQPKWPLLVFLGLYFCFQSSIRWSIYTGRPIRLVLWFCWPHIRDCGSVYAPYNKCNLCFDVNITKVTTWGVTLYMFVDASMTLKWHSAKTRKGRRNAFQTGKDLAFRPLIFRFGQSGSILTAAPPPPWAARSIGQRVVTLSRIAFTFDTAITWEWASVQSQADISP